MNRTFLALAAICAVGVGGMALARHDEKGGAKVTQLSRRDIVEKLDGKDARVTVEEVAIEPGGRVASAPPRRAGVRVRPGRRVRARPRRRPRHDLQGRGHVLRAVRVRPPGDEEPEREAEDAPPRGDPAPPRRREGHGPGGGREERLTGRLPGTAPRTRQAAAGGRTSRASMAGRCPRPCRSPSSSGSGSTARAGRCARIFEETCADGHRVVRAKGYTDYAVAMSAALVEKRCLCSPVPFRAAPGGVFEARPRLSLRRSTSSELRSVHTNGIPANSPV